MLVVLYKKYTRDLDEILPCSGSLLYIKRLAADRVPMQEGPRVPAEI
jgi:hypothetical protein